MPITVAESVLVIWVISARRGCMKACIMFFKKERKFNELPGVPSVNAQRSATLYYYPDRSAGLYPHAKAKGWAGTGFGNIHTALGHCVPSLILLSMLDHMDRLPPRASCDREGVRG